MDSPESTSQTASNESVKVPSAWTVRDNESRTKVALKPFRSLALALGAEDDVEIIGPNLVDVAVVIQALVERAEVILGIPDGSF